MKKIRKQILPILILLFLAISQVIYAQQVDYHPSRIIVKFKEAAYSTSRNSKGEFLSNHSSLQALDRHYSTVKTRPLTKGQSKKSPLKNETDRIAVVEFAQNQDIMAAVDAYKATGLFEYVEPDYVLTADYTPNDALYTANFSTGTVANQWGLYNQGGWTPSVTMNVTADADIDAELAWDIEKGSSRTDLVVAVIDGGLNFNHQDMSTRYWTNPNDNSANSTDDDSNGYTDDTKGWDFYNGDNDPTDDFGHGSNVSSIIAAQGNNTVGMSGILMHNAKVMICKVLNNTNGGGSQSAFVSNVSAALAYAVNNGAHIATMSLGTNAFSYTLRDATDDTYKAGVVMFCSMGNSNLLLRRYPAAYGHTIAVAATKSNDDRYDYGTGAGSNFGTHIDVTAPGVQVYGASHSSNTGYAYLSGTSQSTPHVTGTAGLLLSKYPTLTPPEIRRILQKTSQDRVGNTTEDVTGFDKYFGYGRINAYQALLNASLYARISSFPHIETFETDPGGWYAGDVHTSDAILHTWDWGTPAATTINKAASGTKAWTTNLSGFYNNGEYSYIESPVYDFSALNLPRVNIDVWSDTETGDGALLQYSTDMGTTWTTAGNNTDCLWYTDASISELNTALGGTNPGWSGNATAWKTYSYSIPALAGQSYVQFRVFFAADGTSGVATEDGVAIDNFVVMDGGFYTESFETTNGGWYSGTVAGTLNTWAWGTPSATTMSYAPGGAKAWATNLSGLYAKNERSYLKTPVYDVSGLSNPIVKFNIWIDTRTTDGALLQYSTNGGGTWTNLGSTTSGGCNWYGTASLTAMNTALGGTNPVWMNATSTLQTSAHSISSLSGLCAIQFRFVFVSASGGAAAKEGILIDNFSIQETTSSYPASQDFETSNQVWFAGRASTTIAPSWAWGVPAGTTINSAANNSKAWVTNLSGNYKNGEQGYIESPVYNFTSLSNPLVKFDYWMDAESADGAVLQYSTSQCANSWTTVGALSDPYNWYGSSTVTALTTPAGSSTGWTSSTAGWKTAAHTLTSLAGTANVRFRIFFSADGTSGTATKEGMAVDKFVVEDATIFSSGSWSNSAPDTTKAAVISGAYNSSSNGGDFSCNDLLMNATLTIANGNTISVKDDVLNPANITAQSGSTFNMNGTAFSQQIQGTFSSLTLNNTLGFSLTGATAVSQLLKLTAGTLTTGNNLTLAASASGDPMVAFGAGTVSGNVTMQQYLETNGITGPSYRYMSSPFNGSLVSSLSAPSFTLQIANAATFNSDWRSTLFTGASPLAFPNFFTYDEQRQETTNSGTNNFSKGWFAPTISSTALTLGKGFIVNTPHSQAASFTGTLNTSGTTSVAVTNKKIGTPALTGAGWNLLGNPFPAPINISTFLSNNSSTLAGSVYLRKATAQYAGGWQNLVNGVSSPSGWDGKVATMQSFFVYSSVASGTATFTRSNIASTTYESPTFFRTKADTRPLLRLQVVANGKTDETVFYMEEGATAAFDSQFDAFKIQYNPAGWPTLFSTASSGEMLSINGLPLNGIEETLQPLTLWAEFEGKYSFKMTEMANFEGMAAYLEDKKEGKFTNLAQQSIYEVALAKGMNADRFVLHFGPEKVTGIDQDDWSKAGVNAFTSGNTIFFQIENGQAISVTMVDIAGRELGAWNAIKDGATLSPQLPEGVYLLKVTTAQGVQCTKKVFLAE